LNKNRQRFITLAEKRVTRTIKDLRLVGNLSNRSNYTYDEEDAKKIIQAIKREIKVLELRFQNKGKSDEISFKL